MYTNGKMDVEDNTNVQGILAEGLV